LALVGAGIEQDAAYWEWHINKIPEGSKVEFGVAHMKCRTFYNELDPKNEGTRSWRLFVLVMHLAMSPTSFFVCLFFGCRFATSERQSYDESCRGSRK